MPQNTRVTIGLEYYSFTVRNTITEDKLTNTFASRDKMTGDAPTARTGLAICHRVILDSVAGPGKDTDGTPVLLRRKPWVAQDMLHATPTPSRFGYQQVRGSVVPAKFDW